MGPEGFGSGEFLDIKNNLYRRKSEIILLSLAAINEMHGWSESDREYDWCKYVESPVIYLGQQGENAPKFDAQVARVSWRSDYFGQSNPRSSEGYAYISHGIVNQNDSRYRDRLGWSMAGNIVYGKWESTQFTAHDTPLRVEQRLEAGEPVTVPEVIAAMKFFDAMHENLEKILVDAQDLYLNPRNAR